MRPTASSDLARMVRIDRLFRALNPQAFHDRVGELMRGSLPASSIPGGSRSAEKALPRLDRSDVVLEADTATFSGGLEKVEELLRAAFAVQNKNLLVLGFDAHNPDPEVAAKQMKKARDKASGELVDEREGEFRFQCDMCGEMFKRTKTQRPRGGKCRSCYDWWTTNGRPDPTVLPPHLLERRIEARLRREASG